MLAASLALATLGCADDATDEPRPPTSGERLVRGILGVGPDAKGAQAKAADALVGAIHEQFPGRIDQIERDLHSDDGKRVTEAKRLLDRTIEATAAAAFGGPGANAGFALRTSTVHTADGPVELTPGGDGKLVDGQAELVCAFPRDPAGNPIHLGRGSDGRYGDDSDGVLGALADQAELTAIAAARTVGTSTTLTDLALIDAGQYAPDPESRLGAYAATRGYPEGTVGHAVHNAIATIALSFGTYGEEKIGRVFNAPEARALYNERVDSCAGYTMAVLEYTYWADVLEEDSLSAGGAMGSMFNPTVRNLLQREVFD